MSALDPIVEPSFCELYEYNLAGSEISITTAGDWVKWLTGTIGTKTTDDFIFVDASGINIGPKGAGKYKIDGGSSLSSSKNNILITAGIFVNDALQTNIVFSNKITTAGDSEVVAFSGFLSVAAGDILDVRLTSSANLTTYKIYQGNLNLIRIANG